MTASVRRINRRFLERTLVFLLFVSIMPWPTALAARYANQGSQARPAAILYAATMMMMGVSFAWSWHYLSRRTDLVIEPARPGLAVGFRRALLGGLADVVAILVAFVSPAASFAIDAVVVISFALSTSRVPALLVRVSDSGLD